MNNLQSDRPTSEVMHEATESTRELFASGQRVMENLEDLQNRAERATDWRSHVVGRPMLTLGVAFLGGLLLSRLFAGRD